MKPGYPTGRVAAPSRRGVVAGVVALACLPARAQPRDGRTRSFTILHTNDLHGRPLPFAVAPGDATAQTGDPGREPSTFDRSGRIGGFAALAGAIAARRRASAPTTCCSSTAATRSPTTSSAT